MPVSKNIKDSFKEKLLTIPPNAFLSPCVTQLDNLVKVGKETGVTPSVRIWWKNPYQAYQYVFRHRLAQYIIQDFSNNNHIVTDTLESDLREGGLYFAVSNWLDWQNSYDLHTRYESDVDLRATTGIVLKHPLVILGAAAAISNTYMPEVIQFIPMEYRKDSCQLAANHCRTTYNESVMPKEDMEEAMYAAHRTLNEVAGVKINGY